MECSRLAGLSREGDGWRTALLLLPQVALHCTLLYFTRMHYTVMRCTGLH